MGCRCEDCKYGQSLTVMRFDGGSERAIGCGLTRQFKFEDDDCRWFNSDIDQKDICYTCEYFRGGMDWGLFCTRKEMYYHIGMFLDEPCDYYKRRE